VTFYNVEWFAADDDRKVVKRRRLCQAHVEPVERAIELGLAKARIVPTDRASCNECLEPLEGM